MPTTRGGGLVLAEEGPATPRRRRILRVLVTALVLALLYAGWVGVRGLLTGSPSPTCTANVTGGAAEVSPEQAGNAAVISGVAVKRKLPTRAAVIAVATAMQESKLRNLRFGDRDSLGLFQQRPSQGWGTAEQILDPVYASGAFYDRLVKVKDWQKRPLTEVAQEVQRSAAPTAYAQHEDEALALASALTGASAASLVCRLGDASAPGSAAATVAALGAELGVKGTATDGQVIVPADGQTDWAVGAWAVARAEALGITDVSVGGLGWSRADPESWAGTGDSASSRGPGSAGAAASQVVILHAAG